MTTLITDDSRTTLPANTKVLIRASGIYQFSAAADADIEMSDSENGTYTKEFSIGDGNAKQWVVRSGNYVRASAEAVMQLIWEG